MGSANTDFKVRKPVSFLTKQQEAWEVLHIHR